MRYLPALIAPAALALLALALNLTQSLGAHPWWAQTVILIGLPLGLILAVLLSRWTASWRIAMVVLGTGAAFAAATLGKARFAASYAEDALAGQIWYFGWIATCALASALFATALWPRRGGH